MELWYTDEHTRDVRFSMKVVEQIASRKSAVQQIDILDTQAYGRVLVLDGGLMITEKDEFIYHEMITHVPMAVHPRVKNVLVIGGGDGGTVRELTKYRSIESIDLVEVDKHVVLLARKYLPFTSAKLKDKRVKVWFEEGLRYVRGKKAEYDLIIVDSSDPYGPAEGFFTREFYGTCYTALRDDEGHQGLRAHGQGQQLRPHRGSDGNDAARDHLRHRRRHPRRPPVQGGADRRTLRRHHPAAVPRHPDRQIGRAHV